MMNAADDPLRLGFEPNLTLAGVTFACRSLAQGNALPGVQHLRQLVAHTAAELALRRWLDKIGIRYQLQSLLPITQPQRRSIILGGRRLILHTQLISDSYTRRKLRRNPVTIPTTEIPWAVIPPSLSATEEGDVHLFALVIAAETRTLPALKAAQDRELPLALVALPQSETWIHPEDWQPLGPLAIENHCPHPMQVIILGHGASREAMQHSVHLASHATLSLDLPLHTLLCLRTGSLPAASLRVQSLRQTVLWDVEPNLWHNLWLYGQTFIFLGWITQKQFRTRCSSQTLKPTSMSVQPVRIRAGTLEPMSRLIKLLEQH